MTTRRYFYTDPLAAAFMAKHFGMSFHAEGFDEPTKAPPEELATWGNSPIYIHHDSLHLLEPNTGDTVETTHVVAEIVHHQNSDYMQNNFIRIIERKGLPFMWPESEEV